MKAEYEVTPTTFVILLVLAFLVACALVALGSVIWAASTPIVTGTVVDLSVGGTETETFVVEINGDMHTFARVVEHPSYVYVRVGNPFVGSILVEVPREVCARLEVGDQVKFWR